MAENQELYVRSEARPDVSASDTLARVWYTSTDGKSDFIYWITPGRDETDPASVERFELYLGKEGVVWTATGLQSYVEEVKDPVVKTSQMMNESPMLRVYSGRETMEEFLLRLRVAFQNYREGLPQTLSAWVGEQIDNTRRVTG